MPKRTVRDLEVSGQKVLVRVDFNVPQSADGSVADDRRIRSALPTLNEILDRGGSLILVSHLGRPTGDPVADRAFRMDTVAARLEELIGRPVVKVDDTVGPHAQAACALSGAWRDRRTGKRAVQRRREERRRRVSPRSWPRSPIVTSTTPSAPAIAMKPRWLPFLNSFHRIDARSGSWSKRSCEFSTTLLASPKHPYVAVMGGAKVSDKIGVIENLSKRVDKLLIGGAMTYTFLKARGIAVGKSRVEADKLDVASRLIELLGDKLVLPKDHLVASKPEAGAETKVVGASEIPDGWFGMDIGPETIAALFRDHQPGRHGRVERADGHV